MLLIQIGPASDSTIIDTSTMPDSQATFNCLRRLQAGKTAREFARLHSSYSKRSFKNYLKDSLDQSVSTLLEGLFIFRPGPLGVGVWFSMMKFLTEPDDVRARQVNS